MLRDGTVAYTPSASLHESSYDEAMRGLYRLGWQPAEDHSACCGIPFGDPRRRECEWFALPPIATTADGGLVYDLHEQSMNETPELGTWAATMDELADALGARVVGPAD